MSERIVLTANGQILTADGDIDILEIGPPLDDYPLRLRRLYISQGSEVGDAQEEGLRITVRRFAATVTSGSGGMAPTIEAPDSNTTTRVTAVEGFNDTVATTTGANDVLFDGYWNVRGPLELVWPRDEPDPAPTIRAAEVLIVRCETTAADTIDVSVTAELDEG
jgi:hypothetical protein